MKEFSSLRMLDFFAPLFRKFAIDYDVMRKVLQMKLTMDERRSPTIFNSSKKKTEHQQLKSFGVYALYGLILIPFIFLGENYMLQMSIIFGLTMFILMTTMIADFSVVLLGVRDKEILNTKPVNTRTVSAAKMIHVTIYLSLLTGVFIAIPSLFILGVHGVAPFFLFLAELLLMSLFIIAFTALVYIFILRFFSGEQLKDMINYVQILLSVGIIIGYQIVIRAFDFVGFDFVYVFSWWHVLIPPIWFGAPFELLLQQNTSKIIIILSMLALLVPFISILLYYRLMPSFERNLQKLMENTSRGKRKWFNLSTIWAKITCFNKEERQFFQFASVMMSEEREFKLKVYPSLGIAFVFPFIMIFNQLSVSSFSDIANSKLYLTIYFSTIMVGVAVHMLKFSSKYEGSWIYQATPITNRSAMYSGTLKAFLIRLYLPIFLLLSSLFIWMFSFDILPDLAIVLVTSMLYTLISYKLTNNEIYPFSEPFESAQEAGNSMQQFFLMIFIAGFAGLHYVVTMFEYGVFIYLILLIIVTTVGWRLSFSKRVLKPM